MSSSCKECTLLQEIASQIYEETRDVRGKLTRLQHEMRQVKLGK